MIERGSQVGIFCTFCMVECSTKSGDPKVWKFLKERSTFAPVRISLGARPNELGALFEISTVQRAVCGQKLRVTTEGFLIITVKSMARAEEMTALVFFSQRLHSGDAHSHHKRFGSARRPHNSHEIFVH